MTAARDQILITTCELLEQQGYYATGLNEIIRHSGSPKGSLYYYFPGGKDELTAEALERVGQVVETRITEQLALYPDAAEAILHFINGVAVAVERSDYKGGGPITTVALETAAANERLRRTCDAIYASWQAAIQAKLRASGFSADQSAALAMVVIAGIEGGIILARTGRIQAPLTAVAAAMQRLISTMDKGYNGEMMNDGR